ncbi:MAG TPA: LysM peptidoglycan-binding domain-containing protein [Steroidobacteraceae bacterium]|jgi:LysM repeat protein|nr:LysM peptidoglycan-binding domain-containing protein [Steroidobacteraceae bacterium]
MTFNLAFRTGLSVTLIATAISVSGCASLFGHSPPIEEAAPAAQDTAPAATPAPELTATDAAIQTEARSGVQTAGVAAPTADIIKPTAPTEYTVKRGDTLWGISNVFLKNPWEWPEIWYENPKIQNPHRIYPGDVLVLAYDKAGHPQITIGQEGALRLNPALRSSPLDDAIPTIPLATIQAFLSRPTLLGRDEIKHAPYVLAFPDEHQAAGDDNVVYARGLGNAPTGARFSVMHVGDPIVDTESGKTLGFMGTYTATAVVQRPAAVTRTVLVDAARETLLGDCMVPDVTSAPLSFAPRVPSQKIQGQIIAVVDNVTLIGQYDIVAINRGAHDGVGPGTVLAVDEAGDVVTDRGPASYDNTDRNFFGHAKTVRLPAERAGTVLVFKTYDDMSFGLVVGASTTMRVADVVRNP